MKLSILYIIVGVLIMCACQSDRNNFIPASNAHDNLFTELSVEKTGVDFVNQLSTDTKLNIFEYLYYYNGGGVAVGDFDGDGLEDLFLGANQSSDKIYKNKGNLTFEDISPVSGIDESHTWTSGVSVVDIDHDNDLDIYVCKVSPVSGTSTHNLLYINDGRGHFEEMSEPFGLDFSGYSTQALYLDYDKDGDDDLFLINHSVHSVRSFGHVNQREKFDPLAGDRLFQSQIAQGSQMFKDVTRESGIISSALGYGLSGAVHDFNQDGWLDIYVCNDFHENDYLYINNKDGSFTEGIMDWFQQSSKFSMGIDIADMDNDHSMDVFTTDMLPWDKEVAMRSSGEDSDKVYSIRKGLGFAPQYARNHLQLSYNDGKYVDFGLYTDTYATDWSWSVLCQDFDHNGLTDIYITNGIVKRPNDLEYIKFLNSRGEMLEDSITEKELETVLNEMPTQPLSNILFRQDSTLAFTDVKKSLVGTPTFSNGSAYADLDGDGDLDLITNNINQPTTILRNNSDKPNYITYDLESEQSLIGTQINIRGKGINLIKIHNPIRGYQSSSTQRLHFPLPANITIDSAIITWPNGETRLLTTQETNRKYTISPTSGSPYNNIQETGGPKIANYDVSELPYLHLDNEYADYDHDKLIPEKLSTEGQAVVVADFTGDKIPDIYLGGGKFSEAQLLAGKKGGGYTLIDNLDFRKDAKYEDTACCALDFDNDGDLDLYVVSGGNDVPELNELIQDRLYLNDGGNLKRLPISLPFTNGSTVSAGDVNGDGFPDLFIGARSIPNSYGLSPYSFLLSNKGGFGLDIIWKKRLGLVTDSEIIDIDGDSNNDLVIAGDWMPILIGIYDGEEISFDNLYAKSVSKVAGMWNCVSLHDINDDGILDIVGGNVGKNFKWKPTMNRPIELYVSDIDENSSTESFMFSDYFGDLMPLHSLDRMIDQVPALKKDFISYHDFSKIDGIDALTQKAIVEHKVLTELRSFVFISNEGKYDPHPLPSELQYSSIKDVVFLGDQFFYLGNEDRFITELGTQSGLPGGSALITFTDKLNIDNHSLLNLDPKLKTRRLALIDQNTIVITSYKSNPLLLNVNL